MNNLIPVKILNVREEEIRLRVENFGMYQICQFSDSTDKSVSRVDKVLNMLNTEQG